ncbi:hypothetical protein DF160_06970 [Burkholderia anthina]|nr:hemagglutinin repeat-containing protein [Burkholderia anthina]RQV85337.1 hypothetical protein DF160_06970 [Burkholderia anthina]
MADLVGATGNMTKALNDSNGKPEAKIELSFGSSHSKTTFTEDSRQNNGSSVKAGGTAAFVATGDKNAGQGNVTIQGSDVNAKDVLLQATNKVNPVNSTDTDSARSTNESKRERGGVIWHRRIRRLGVDVACARRCEFGCGDAEQYTHQHKQHRDDY